MMIWFGIAAIIVTIYFLVKRYDARMVLIASGIIMCLSVKAPMDAFKAFATNMTNAGLIQAVCSVMGFAMVMKYTECDKHLITLIGNFLAKVRPLLIPGAVIGTFVINVALPSAAGTAAAVGAIFIPILIGAGVHPAMAAAAVKSGTYGSMLNPGLVHNPMVAKIAGVNVMDVIAFHYKANIASVIIAGIVITFLAYILKEHKGYETDSFKVDSSFKPNFVYALVPIMPIAILLLCTRPEFKSVNMTVPAAMIIGVLIGLAVTRKNPAKMVKAFFDGMGGAYADIIGIIVAAGVFVSGLTAVGLVKAFIAAMTSMPSIVKICAAVGPFLLGVISGSGDAATVAFNNAVTPHAAEFGLSTLQMGSMATLGGTLGRTMSPIAGATIICAGIAGANPMDVAKRTCPGVTLAMLVGMFLLMF
ncbi:MAG: C4-dicarboxylate transporter DcuC [Acidaminococcales bacterium]|jgi:DcuC family C4-dicarboxylate transporter|nr:C4-dicarboxylate transporter DcuC [Acidaminococcales bacterium]